jgi:hypothetical protein
MKKLFVLLILALAIVSANAQSPHALWNEGIRGPVKNIVETEYPADAVGKKKSVLSTAEIKCNRQGMLQSQVVQSEESGYARYAYRHDEDGRLTERRIYYKNEKLNVRNEFRYDESGYPLALDTYEGSDGHLYGRCEITFRDGAYYEKTYWFDKWDWTFAYNAQGDMIRERDGEYRYIYKYTCDDRGNWTRRVRYRSSDEDDRSMETDRITLRKIAYW